MSAMQYMWFGMSAVSLLGTVAVVWITLRIRVDNLEMKDAILKEIRTEYATRKEFEATYARVADRLRNLEQRAWR